MKITASLLMYTSIFIFVVGELKAEDWPQWLGMNRDAIWRETGIINTFDEVKPKLIWKAKIGGGYSGPAVSGGRVFVMDRVGHDTDLKNGSLLHAGDPPKNPNFIKRMLPGFERLLCFDEKNGQIIWEHKYDCPYRSVAIYAIGPRVTPTVDGDHVYTLGAEGNLLCLKVETGNLLWSRNLRVEFDITTPEWGFSAHPLVDGNKLICMVGGKHSTVVAFDKLTGQEIWRSGNARQPGYCAPVIYTLGGERQLIVWDSDQLRGLNPETGRAYWEVDVKPTFAMSIGVPQHEGNRLFVMGYSHVSAMIEVAENGNSAEVIWRGDTTRGIGGVFNTAVIRDGHVYGCGQNGRYICIRLEDGKRRWSTFEPSTGYRPSSWANVFTVQNGENYWLFNDLGDVVIAKMNPQGFQMISKTHLIEPTHRVGNRMVVWSHPALANACVFIRNDKEIRCYNVAQQ
ncbi:TPA: pyrrolo-quinoline quinone [Candidatus Poribacteria bacterium]|nr:pyrrolo-quinoline quinone [Candidatus Poribacteria bacterium]HIB91921.1 pyrrolo-quinoline quinone [Candidatus Poribacteria bacterium]HIB98404.1 pyrrolo-quinoline quinone [Candidatus Poribacteria bacterium]HIN28357.1 pyrrolo-quinoline quinone [Candidatus Poribacteria bacterium]HIO07008.1 pyrrolo-quinoline quinone [Candidatus Poribacteria bacterium]